MRIRTQFIITILLFGIILVVIAASAIITHQKLEKASQQENLAANIAQGASELSYLSNDYLIYRESQQLSRWQLRFASFSNEVTSLNVEKPEQQVLIRNIRANEQRLKQVFDSVVSAIGGPSQNRSTALDLAFLQVSWSRMAVQSQGLVSDASRLSQLLHQQMDQLTGTRTVLMYVMVGLFGALLLASYMLTYRRILKSIATLQAGAAVIGSGNLDFIIEGKRNDEIGDLSHVLNQMTINLKTVTASKADLEREVVERKRAEEALLETHERAVWLSRFPDQNPNPIIRASADGTVLYCNPASAKLHGWTCEVGQLLQNELLPLLGRAMAEGKEVQEDLLLAGRFYVVWIAPFPEERYANIYGRDITERKRAEEALRQSEQRLSRAQEIAHLGSWELDLINNRLTWSDEVYRIFGLQPQEFGATYEAFLEAVHPDDRAAVDAAYSGSVREGRDAYEIEHRMIRKSTGEIRIVHERCEHIRNASGRIIRSIGMVHDITERKQAEEGLRQRTFDLQRLTETLEQRVQERTVDLEKANEALRNLSSRLMSVQEDERKRIAGELHDTIGSCLSGVKFKIENVLQQVGKAPTVVGESLSTIIPVIQEGIEECRRMQQDLRPSMLDDLGLLPTLSWFCRRYQTIYTGIKIDLEQTLEESDIPNSLKIVIYRVTQEGMNNIAKHSKADLVHLSLRKMESSIELSIEDNGAGFNPQTIKQRLGLMNMRERTELSGGTFEVKSTIGKGTTIRTEWTI